MIDYKQEEFFMVRCVLTEKRESSNLKEERLF